MDAKVGARRGGRALGEGGTATCKLGPAGKVAGGELLLQPQALLAPLLLADRQKLLRRLRF
jgi:hypothetical protein